MTLPRALILSTFLALPLGIFGALSAASVQAQEAAAVQNRTISVTGIGSVRATPDIAILSLGISHKGATAKEAMDQTSGTMNAVIEGLKSLGFGVTDMQTTGLSLNPVYEDGYNASSKLMGFVASNGVTLRVKDLGRLGEIIDLVVSKGANTVNGLTFDVMDKTAATVDARTKALQDAKTKAEQMAAALGASIGRPVSITENYTSSDGAQMVQTMRTDTSPSTPVAPGEVGLDVSVSVVFELN